ncbi:hypothetical protein B0H14DRAFT_2399676, partial [Mycena olivaceomarginata]
GLDPKRAKAFNGPVVGRFFDKLTKTINEHEIPIENVYNMDERSWEEGHPAQVSVPAQTEGQV